MLKDGKDGAYLVISYNSNYKVPCEYTGGAMWTDSSSLPFLLTIHTSK